jgi:predicted CXXCH cytochrome family protein
MRVRTAKQRAQRIDLNYFKHAHGMKKWRIMLSLALPAAAILWVSAFAAAGSRAPYSAGPVSSAHAFAEMRCEVCHTGAAATAGFRAHTTDSACLTCHDAPKHAANQTPEPACATCHQEHRGRVQLAKMDDGLCVECHGDLKTTQGAPKVATAVHGFPSGHPEFAALKSGAPDPGKLRFNHAVHIKDSLRGPTGPEKLECSTCHKPQLATSGVRAKGPATTGLMEPITYDQNCARCHPLFFDERVEQEAPHVSPESVRAFVQQALVGYIRQNPGDINKPDSAFRRVPLNFPRPTEAPARNAQEWVARRAVADERILWNKTCAECHDREGSAAPAAPATGATVPVPTYQKTNLTARWMPKAGFDHTPHLMVKCQSCHAAEGSTRTADVLMPNQAVCATCHTSAKGALGQGTARAEGRCFECHQYHDWTQAKPVTPSYSLTDFK